MRKDVIMLFVLSVVIIVLLGLLGWSIWSSGAEQLKYQVIARDGDIEIRDYSPMIVAEVESLGERSQAINNGFMQLTDYIFGKNTSRVNIAMTAPVLQQAHENLSMTAPVMQQRVQRGWLVQFVMPSNYEMDSLPKPDNNDIHLRPIPGKRFVAIRFSGIATEKVLNHRLEKLESYLEGQKYKSLSKPIYAFYNPPWTLPFLRRTEILIEIAPL